MFLFQNRAHGTSSRYKLATTNHHGHDFSIGKLATASFPSSISMCSYPRRKCLCQKEIQQSLAFLDLVTCAYFKIEYMTQAQGISQQPPITVPGVFLSIFIFKRRGWSSLPVDKEIINNFTPLREDTTTLMVRNIPQAMR